jgi:hypothetical protein
MEWGDWPTGHAITIRVLPKPGDAGACEGGMTCLFSGGVFLMAGTASVQPSSDLGFPSDPKIHRIIADRIEDRKQGIGIVVGLVGT